ncbi:MAG TPA: hypothetical protein VGL59_20590 [Polyangia bacterium]|jgi:hypothetical protein
MVNAPGAPRTALLALAGLPLLIGLPAPAALAAPPKVQGPPLQNPAHVLKPADGYYDDSFTLDSQGQRLAVIRTDGATFSTIEIVDLGSGKVQSSVDLGKSDQQPESVELLPDGKSVLLVVRDGLTDRVWASVFDEGGHPVAKTTMHSAFGRAALPGGKDGSEAALVGLDQHGGGVGSLATGADTNYTVAAYRLTNLAPIGKPRSFRIGVDKELKGTDIKVAGFADGYTHLIGQRAGTYDKKQDFRRPSRIVVFDTLEGKVASEREIEDVYAWTRATALLDHQPNRTALAQLTTDHDGVQVIDPSGKITPVTLAVPFRLYDNTSLKDQEGPEPATLYVSLAIDPVNPDAIARQKTDTPALDLYAVDLNNHKARHRARILLTRPVLWKAGNGKLVVLKRFKSFPRGGDELDIYDLP